MNAFEKIIYFLQFEVDTPPSYGAFHIISFLTIIALTVFVCIKFRNCSDKVYRLIVLIAWGIMVLLEVYRELVFSFTYDGSVVTWDYAWYQFPFQFCATPLYVLPIIGFIKNGRIRDAAMAYTALFSIIGGIGVMFYPGDVLCSYLGINIQSMIHHGFMLVLGVFTLVYNRKNLTAFYYLKGAAVFAVMITIALILNITVYEYLTANAMDDTFNMFFISPYFDCTLPVLSTIKSLVPYIVFLLTYIVAVLIAAGAVFWIAKGIILALNKTLNKTDA